MLLQFPLYKHCKMFMQIYLLEDKSRASQQVIGVGRPNQQPN